MRAAFVDDCAAPVATLLGLISTGARWNQIPQTPAEKGSDVCIVVVDLVSCGWRQETLPCNRSARAEQAYAPVRIELLPEVIEAMTPSCLQICAEQVSCWGRWAEWVFGWLCGW